MTSRGRHVDQLISASLAGELTDAEHIELDAHLVGCEQCRNTLAAFTAERRILSGLPVAEPPRDLGLRVLKGIESGRLAPWWRRPGALIAIGASAAAVAAAVLAFVVFSNFDLGPVGQQSGSPHASASVAPSSSSTASLAPSVKPSVAPTFLGPGDLGYLSLTGAPLEALHLSFIDDASGASIDAGTVSGPPVSAALSPDGQWLGYITQKGETGANEVWVLHLTDGEVLPLGCSSSAPFTDRLAWSPDSRYLAYTLVAVDLGPSAGCPADDSASAGADAWIFETPIGARRNLTRAGNAYAASFAASDPPALLVSFAAEQPSTTPVDPATGAPVVADAFAENVFMPLFSPDGSRAIFWSGTMTLNGGSWHYSTGGMPQLSRDFRSAGPASPWVGTPLFTDLVPVGGEAFVSGDFVWGPDSDQLAFWDGAWTGAPQTADGSYPSQTDAYVGSVSGGLLSSASTLSLVRPADAYLVAIAFAPDGRAVAVTLGLPSAGIGDPPSALLQIVPLGTGSPRSVGGGDQAPPWNGPAVFGY